VLRGLPDQGPVIPEHFLENASAAVQAAIAIINLLLEDKDAQTAIAYVPHHIHGMVAFAAMFLLRIATKHSEQLFVDRSRYQRLIGALAQHFKSVDVGKDHLIHRMAEGLEKMSESLGGPSRRMRKGNKSQDLGRAERPALNTTQSQLTNGSTELPDYSALDPNAFDFGDPSINLGMPFFDFEGGTLNGPGGNSMWNFN
jgi:hypothetical protein